MKHQDVVKESNSNTEGGVHIFNGSIRISAGNAMDGFDNVTAKHHMYFNERGKKMAGCSSEKRCNIGEYLLLFLLPFLVLCLVNANIPFACQKPSSLEVGKRF